MGYSHSSQLGIKANGRAWKSTIRGIPAINDEIDRLIEERPKDVKERIEAQLRLVHLLFAPHFSGMNATSGEIEALEWFEEESPGYELENETMDEWQQEYNYRLGELYDFADYNRIWVSPDRQHKEDA